MGVKAGEMLDRCSGTWWTGCPDPARPGSPQEGPARSVATARRLAERSAGGPCGPTGASVLVSRSRRRRAQVERADLVGAEHDVKAAIRCCWLHGHTTVREGLAELDWTIAKAQPAAAVDPAEDRTGTIVKGLDRLRKAASARAVARGRGRQ